MARTRGTLTQGAIIIGGGLGALIRYELGLRYADPVPPNFPWVTFAINMTGAFLLGFVATMLTTSWVDTVYLRPFVVVGVLGGLTTWSRFIVECDQLFSAGQTPLALTYIVASIGLGLVAAAAGALLGRVVGGSSPASE